MNLNNAMTYACTIILLRVGWPFTKKKISMLDKVTKKQTMQMKNLEYINTKELQDLMLKIIF